jgi:hypothetical protein
MSAGISLVRRGSEGGMWFLSEFGGLRRLPFAVGINGYLLDGYLPRDAATNPAGICMSTSSISFTNIPVLDLAHTISREPALPVKCSERESVLLMYRTILQNTAGFIEKTNSG